MFDEIITYPYGTKTFKVDKSCTDCYVLLIVKMLQ